MNQPKKKWIDEEQVYFDCLVSPLGRYNRSCNKYETSCESHFISRYIDQNRPPVFFYHVGDTHTSTNQGRG